MFFLQCKSLPPKVRQTKNYLTFLLNPEVALSHSSFSGEDCPQRIWKYFAIGAINFTMEKSQWNVQIGRERCRGRGPEMSPGTVLEPFPASRVTSSFCDFIVKKFTFALAKCFCTNLLGNIKWIFSTSFKFISFIGLFMKMNS